MDASAFVDPSTGHLVRTINGHQAFVPAPLPPDLDMGALAIPLADAMKAVGELQGACRRLANPYFLVRPLQRREALTSSAMEGTFTTDDDLLLAEIGFEDRRDDAAREVNNYLRALSEALAAMNRIPLSHRVLRTAHKTLLAGVTPRRGANKRPGEYKIDQNAIGGRTLDDARFIPPPPEEARRCMDELEAYINRGGREGTPALLDMALVHYQLETIHPFADGNGRVGRMLISLMAVERNLLEMPVLYMSPALEANKDEYIDLMFNVSARGDWNAWLMFFFRMVCVSAAETISTIDRLIALQVDYRDRAARAMRSANAVNLVDFLFERAAVTVPDVQRQLNVTYHGARNIVSKLVEVEILREVPGLYPKVFVASGILRVAEPPGPKS
jgi:Fic family protein